MTPMQQELIQLKNENGKLKACLESLQQYALLKPYTEGWLSSKLRYEIKISGGFTSRDLATLIKKIEIDRQILEEDEKSAPPDALAAGTMNEGGENG